MSVRLDQETGDLIIDGWEKGIASSPHQGIANIQNANISTETGEVMASFVRAQQTMTSTSSGTGSLTFVDTNHVGLSISGSNNLFKGNWITVTNSNHTGELPNGTYYVPPSSGAGFELSNYYNTATYFPATVSVNYLALGGGGGGGFGSANGGGGGGGGGQVVASSFSVSNTGYAVVVGAGGAGSASTTGATGVASTVFGATAAAGVGGTFNGSDPGNGGVSGSGQTGGAGSGILGGGGGGGGGDSAPGTGGATTGNGGNGTPNSLSGASVVYGGGGGGGGYSSNGTGGTGGGAAGGTGAASGSSAAANTGAGGGGDGTTGATGGNGGSGIVIISVPIGTITSATGGAHTTSGGNDIWTFTSSGTWTPTIAAVTPPTIITGFTAGLTATIQLVARMGSPLATATENYFLSGTRYNRYYVLDNQNLVWVYDTQNESLYSSTDNVNWLLPDYQTGWCTHASGIGVINGMLIGATEHGLFAKPTVLLGQTNSVTTTWVQVPDFTAWKGTARSTSAVHACFTGHQGTMYITDGSYIASIFPDSTIAASGVTGDNVQTMASYTFSGGAPNDGDYSVITGVTLSTSDSLRVPVVFFTPNGGVLPTAITAGTVYYALPSIVHIEVYTAPTGGSALDIQAGAFGTQYFTTFYPTSSDASSTGTHKTLVATGDRLTLPNFEVSQCIAEINNTVLIGCAGSTVYPWDQVSNLPSGLINLPESNTVNIVTVNQMAYVFAGNNGNVYITDGSVASLVLNIPDYVAGIPGQPGSYIESTYYWGGAMYLRGRVYFSVLDQNSGKAGNCGGVWSFIPTQNLYIGQDVGISPRLESQNSYNTYNGTAPLLIPKQIQNATSPLYWSAWYSDISSPAYGIDYSTTGTSASFPAVIDTDVIPIGTMLKKKTFKEIEYKLASPLDVGATVAVRYRNNLTGAWISCSTFITDSSKLGGYVRPSFQQGQWLQLQVILTPVTSTANTNSFVRLTEIRIR
jgi:hypothetical protein